MREDNNCDLKLEEKDIFSTTSLKEAILRVADDLDSEAIIESNFILSEVIDSLLVIIGAVIADKLKNLGQPIDKHYEKVKSWVLSIIDSLDEMEDQIEFSSSEVVNTLIFKLLDEIENKILDMLIKDDEEEEEDN